MGYTAIVDYGVGNLKSLTNAMKYLGLPSRITSDRAELERADAILLPGVGAFPRRGGAAPGDRPGGPADGAGGQEAHAGHLPGDAAAL